MPAPNGITFAMKVSSVLKGGHIYDDTDQHFDNRLCQGSFQVCAIVLDGAVLYNRLLSRPRLAAIYLDQIVNLTETTERLAKEFEVTTKTDDLLRQLCIIPEIGPLPVGDVAVFVPDLDTFDSSRNFAAWLGFVP